MTRPFFRLWFLLVAPWLGASVVLAGQDLAYHTVAYDQFDLPAPSTRIVKFDGGAWYYAKTVSFTVRAGLCHTVLVLMSM